MRKGYTLIELLAVIVILAVISVIAYPKITDLVAISKIKAYDVAKKNIVESAKVKYVASVNSLGMTQYYVSDLIDEGYISKNTKNPLTNEKYPDNTKVLITNDGNNITYEYVEGTTMYDIVSKKHETDGLYKIDNEYVYKGISANNYISFNEKIYRIAKVDSLGNTYLVSDENNKPINISTINNYKALYYNDNYSEKSKNNISSFNILDYNTYLNSYLDGQSYILNNNDLWITDKSTYKVLSATYDNMSNIQEDNANVRFIIKLKPSVIVQSGSGTQLDPYKIEES